MDNLQEDKWQEIIAASVTETFENMAFMAVARTSEGDPVIGKSDVLKTSILVYEPCQGEFSLILPISFTTGIAKTIYGLPDENITEEVLLDLLSEILNTIAGRVMTRILPEDMTFSLGIPEPGADAILDQDSQTVACRFIAGGEPFTVVASGNMFLA